MEHNHCPLCNHQTAGLSTVNPDFNTDPMGRKQFSCNACDHRLTLIQVGDKQELMPSPEGENWNSNGKQFPRFLAEIWATGLRGDQYDSLSESMGLDSQQIDDLFERADYIWQREKDLTFKPKDARWILRGDEDLYLMDTQTDRVITIPGNFPERLARHIAFEMLNFLNTDARTR